MEYDCECGCGVKVEKTISASDACRMRIKRGHVRNTNGIVPSMFDKRTDSVRKTNSFTIVEE